MCRQEGRYRGIDELANAHARRVADERARELAQDAAKDLARKQARGALAALPGW